MNIVDRVEETVFTRGMTKNLWEVSSYGRNHYVVDSVSREIQTSFTSKKKAQARADEHNENVR